jgi:hypothetical protein
MKYAEIIITINPSSIGDRKNIEITIPKINKDAPYVGLKLHEREKLNDYGERYGITNTYASYIGFNHQELRIPICPADEVNRQTPASMITVNLSTNSSLGVMNRVFNLFMWKLILSLYYWDKRCQRSVRVQSKETVDIPLKIIMNGSTIEVSLEQMKTFAEFIKNK